MNMKRTSQGLRDILFDELEELQSGNGDPRRALAVANVARQIVNTVKAELDFAKQMEVLREKGGDAELGTLALGTEQSSAVSVGKAARGRSSAIRRSEPAQ